MKIIESRDNTEELASQVEVLISHGYTVDSIARELSAGGVEARVLSSQEISDLPLSEGFNPKRMARHIASGVMTVMMGLGSALGIGLIITGSGIEDITGLVITVASSALAASILSSLVTDLQQSEDEKTIDDGFL